MSAEESVPPVPHRAPAWSVPRRPVLVALVVVLALGIGAIGYAIGNAGSSPAGRISVTGSATVMGVPDSVSFTIGVQTTNANASVCLAANDRRVAALEAALRRAGVPTKGMQTSDLEIYDDTNDSGQVTGFTVDNTLNVTMSDIARAGHAIEAAAKVAGNGIQLYGISFSLVNDPHLMATARTKAVDAAHEQATDLARASGTSLSGVLSITDDENVPSGSTFPQPLAVYASGTAVPIEAGQQAVTIQVSVVYALSN